MLQTGLTSERRPLTDLSVMQATSSFDHSLSSLGPQPSLQVQLQESGVGLVSLGTTLGALARGAGGARYYKSRPKWH